jgi:hypothetical protein
MAIVTLQSPSGVITKHTGTPPFTITGLTEVGTYIFTEGLTNRNVTVTSSTPTPTPSPTMADAFTAADGTVLPGRTADTGGIWQLQPGSTAPASGSEARIASNRVYFPLGAAYQLPTALAENCYVQCDFTTFATPTADGTNNAQPGIILRASDTAATFYMIRQQVRPGATSGTTSGTWECVRFVNGAATVVGSFGVTASSGTKTMRVTATTGGSAVTFVLTVDGTQVGTVNDTSSSRILGAGRAGLRVTYGGAYVSSATDGVHFDNFSAGAI